MSPENILGLVIFLWMVAVFGILRFFRAAHPYREGSAEQRAEDREQERFLRNTVKRRGARSKK